MGKADNLAREELIMAQAYLEHRFGITKGMIDRGLIKDDTFFQAKQAAAKRAIELIQGVIDGK